MDHPKGWKFLQVHKSGQITQKGWKFLKSAKWTDPPEGENSFKSTKVDKSPKRVKVLKVHKKDRPLKEGENSYKSNTRTEIN